VFAFFVSLVRLFWTPSLVRAIWWQLSHVHDFYFALFLLSLSLSVSLSISLSVSLSVVFSVFVSSLSLIQALACSLCLFLFLTQALFFCPSLSPSFCQLLCLSSCLFAPSLACVRSLSPSFCLSNLLCLSRTHTLEKYRPKNMLCKNNRICDRIH